MTSLSRKVKGAKEENTASRDHNSEKILRRALQRIDDNSDQNNKEPLHFSSCTPNNVRTTLNCPFRQLAAPALYRTESCPYILYSKKPKVV